MLARNAKTKTKPHPARTTAAEDQNRRSNSLRDKHIEQLSSRLVRSRSRPAGAGWFFGVSRKQLAQFTHQLATLQSAGLTIVHSLQILERQRAIGATLQRCPQRRRRQGRRCAEKTLNKAASAGLLNV